MSLFQKGDFPKRNRRMFGSLPLTISGALHMFKVSISVSIFLVNDSMSSAFCDVFSLQMRS